MFPFIYLFTGFIALVLKPEKFSPFSEEYNFLLSVIYIFVLSIFIFQQRYKDKNWLRFDILFLLGYTIVHFQIPFLASIGIEPSRPWHIWLNKEVVNYATWMSLVSITIWFFGYSLIIQPKRKKIPVMPKKINTNVIDKLLPWIFIGFLFSAGKNFLGGAYDVTSWGGAATYFLLILKVLIYLRIIYFFVLLDEQKSLFEITKSVLANKVFVLTVILYFALFFITGSRGEILRVILVTVFAYSIFVKSLSFRFIIVSVLIGSFVFTIMGMGRGRIATELGDQTLLQRGYASYIESDEKKLPTEELASSVRIQYRAIDAIPNTHPYLYGVPYFLTMISPIPFSNKLVIETFDIPYQYQASSRLFTYLGQGNNITYGEGSEVLADIYANFDLVGVFIIMLFFGSFAGIVTKKTKQGNFNYMLVHMVLLITALSMNRGTIFYAYKEIFYILFFHLLFSGRLRWKK